MTKLPPNVLNSVREAYKVYSNLVSIIETRINYIIEFITNKNPDTWHETIEDWRDDMIYVEGGWWELTEPFIDKNNKKMNLSDFEGIPTRWLFEDFEDEYKNGVKLYKEQKAVKKLKTKELKLQKQQEKEALRQSAASKLTLEEKEALGLF